MVSTRQLVIKKISYLVFFILVFFTSCNRKPSVKISTPDSYYLQGNSNLFIKAEAHHLPRGYGILFVVDHETNKEQSISDYNAPYETVFTNLAKSEHVVDAFVVDALGNKILGSETHDRKVQIGIGDYYVAIGDSITAGGGDDDPSDEISQDGRNKGGYEPILNNLLTAVKGYPHTIVNEGKGGTTTADELSSIQKILAKHPNAQYYLVMYGMNDARPWAPIPSGKGLNPGDPGYPATFKDNMQRIIDAINNNGKKVYLAKSQIALGDGARSDRYADPYQGPRSLLIKEYNEVIDELINNPKNNISVTPPDFYSYFGCLDTVTGHYRYEDEYTDNIHPNGIGYRSMANLWFRALSSNSNGLVQMQKQEKKK